MDRSPRESNTLKYIGGVILLIIAGITGLMKIKTPLGDMDLMGMMKMMKTSDRMGDLNIGLLDMSAVSDVVTDMMRFLVGLILALVILALIETILVLAFRVNYLPVVLALSIPVNVVVAWIFLRQISRIDTLVSETVPMIGPGIIKVDPIYPGLWIAAHMALVVLIIVAVVSRRKRENREELFREERFIIERPL